MNLKLLFLVSLLISVKMLLSQQINQSVISSDGGYAINNQYSITYTIGELVSDFATDTSLNVDLTQGFNQSFLNIVSVDNLFFDVDINVFPNPTHDFLNVEVLSSHNNLSINLFDISGKLIRENDISQNKFSISFSDLAAGNYFLVFLNNNEKLKTIKVNKSL